MGWGRATLALHRFSSKWLSQDTARSTRQTWQGKFVPPQPSTVPAGMLCPRVSVLLVAGGAGKVEAGSTALHPSVCPSLWVLGACSCWLASASCSESTMHSEPRAAVCARGRRSQSPSPAQAVRRRGGLAASTAPGSHRHGARPSSLQSWAGAGTAGPHARSEGRQRGFCRSVKHQSEGERTWHVAGDCSSPHPLCTSRPHWPFPTSPFDPQISKRFRALQMGHQDMRICSFQTCCSLGSCPKLSHCARGLGLGGDAGKGIYVGGGTSERSSSGETWSAETDQQPTQNKHNLHNERAPEPPHSYRSGTCGLLSPGHGTGHAVPPSFTP